MRIEEIKDIVKNDLLKINVKLEDEEDKKIICFDKSSTADYKIFIENRLYYFVESDFGREEKIKVSSKNYREVLFELYRHYAFFLASIYERRNRIPNQDFRILLFDKELALLKKIDNYYYFKEKQFIDSILLKYPYK